VVAEILDSGIFFSIPIGAVLPIQDTTMELLQAIYNARHALRHSLGSDSEWSNMQKKATTKVDFAVLATVEPSLVPAQDLSRAKLIFMGGVASV